MRLEHHFNMKSLYLILLLTVLFFKISKTEAHSVYRLDAAYIEQLFCNSVEVLGSGEEVTARKFENVDKNLLAISAIFCGTVGFHRYLMGHDIAGTTHLAWTGVSALVLLIGVGVLASGNNSTVEQGFNIASFAVGITFVHLVYNVAEGLVYLITPQRRFNDKNGLRYDSYFCGTFARHHLN